MNDVACLRLLSPHGYLLMLQWTPIVSTSSEL